MKLTKFLKNENIYNEITNNCINDSLKGTYFTFIAYGDSTSEKRDLIFGKNGSDQMNENRGLFIRLVQDYLTIKQSRNIILKINFIAVNGNKIIDLYKLNEINDKIHTKITQNELLDKYSIDIKMNNEILQKMKLVNINNLKDVFFMFRVYSLLERLDEGLFHLLSWSNFAFIINIFDNSNNLISKNTFIILAGNEKINTKITNPHSYNKNTIGNTKYRVDIEYTFDDIINNLKTNQLSENEAEYLLSQSK